MRVAFELSLVNAQVFRSVEVTLLLVTGNFGTVLEGRKCGCGSLFALKIFAVMIILFFLGEIFLHVASFLKLNLYSLNFNCY